MGSEKPRADPMNRQWLLVTRPEGPVGEQNFRRVETPVPVPVDGQVRVRNLWLSFDPHLAVDIRSSDPRHGIPIGGVIPALGVGRVDESRHPDFRAGDLVNGLLAWEDYTITEGGGVFPLTKIPPDVPPNLTLGVLGLTGMTAYFGVLSVGQPRSGETFVVSGAAGAVGSVAGQIAKIHGLRVVGIAGGPEKCQWLVREAGFDGAIDYRTENVGDRLAALCPKGIDIFFDNVGGPALDAALAHLRRNARVVLCGGISHYEDRTPTPGPSNYLSLILRHGRMEGFLISDYADRFGEALTALSGWLRAGKLRPKEDVMVGLDGAPRAFARLFSGANFGKQLLKIDAPSE